ncbi:MAG: DUF2953 domain-containing protein, partial [Clostridiales bacterium]|nr:DUF2953 domain-containing protein [Clostridiales bacterium]
ISNDKKNDISKKDHIKEKSEKKKKNITLLRIIKYIRSVNKSKYKPTLKTTGNIDYSLEDSSDTAIIFGLSSILYGFTYNFLSIFLKVKKYDIAINPLFKNQIYIKANIKCIVRVSIGHIIYMFYLILKEIIVEKVKKYE